MKTPLDTEVDLCPGHIVLDGVRAARERGTADPSFRPMPIVTMVAHLSDCRALVTFRLRCGQGEMYIGHGVFVCPSLAAFPHYCTDRDVTWGMVGARVPSSCALLGGFAIGARVSLL